MARARAEAAQRARADAQARAQQAQARAQQARAQQAQARAQQATRTGAQRAAASHLKPLQSSARSRSGGEEREEFAALQSRRRVQESFERVRAAERKVVGKSGTAGATAATQRQEASGIATDSIRAMFRSPSLLREAFLVAEILGSPRGVPPDAVRLVGF